MTGVDAKEQELQRDLRELRDLDTFHLNALGNYLKLVENTG